MFGMISMGDITVYCADISALISLADRLTHETITPQLMVTWSSNPEAYHNSQSRVCSCLFVKILIIFFGFFARDSGNRMSHILIYIVLVNIFRKKDVKRVWMEWNQH